MTDDYLLLLPLPLTTHINSSDSFVSKLPASWNGTLVLSDFSFTAKRPNMEYGEKHEAYRSDLKEKLNTMKDKRVRWLDGMGIAKEMRLYSEWGENHMAQSQHFHHFCNETFVDLDREVKAMNVCSNITEMVAHLLLGHAIGPTELLLKEEQSLDEHNIDTSLKYCHACPRRLLPFHITPRPDMICELGAFHERTDIEELAAVCSKSSGTESFDTCPESCMREEVSYQFDSQSDVVNVRECEIQFTSALSDQTNEAVLDDADDTSVKDKSAIPSWMNSNLADASQIECHDTDVPFYWNIPESGGTTIQNLYMCMGLTIANELGKVAYINETKLIKFLPFHGMEWPVLNVDTSTKEGILRAKNLGLVSSTNPSVDIVVSPHLRFAAQELFNSHRKGKVFTIFRHPVNRELSHHQNGTSIDNWVVRNLVGKEDPNEPITAEDLKLAKDIVRSKIIVGLESRFVKSFDRFNAYIGVKIHKRWTRGRCIREYVHKKGVGAQEVTASSDQIKAASERHAFDILLYEYAEGLFNEQEMLLSNLKTEDSS